MNFIRTDKDINLIHTGNGIIPLNHKPWVVSVEYFSSFFNLNHDLALLKKSRDRLQRHLTSKYCRKILCFTETCRQSIINGYSPQKSDYYNKLDVIYPTIKPNLRKQQNSDEIIKILFIGASFFEKGGRELVESLDIVRKNTSKQVILTIFTQKPKFYQDIFYNFINKYIKEKNNIFKTEWIPREKLFTDYYLQADIFAFPTFGDQCPYSIFEAMSFGLPIISQNVHTMPELVEDKFNGLLVQNPDSPVLSNSIMKNQTEIEKFVYRIYHNRYDGLIKELAEKLLILINEKPIRMKLGNNGYSLISEGKYSIKTRNKKLSRIYIEAIE